MRKNDNGFLTERTWIAFPGGDRIEAPASPTFEPYRNEPTFALELIKQSVSLHIGKQRYRPLCVEFPGGSGIDAIHLGDQGGILLSELKLWIPARLGQQADQALHRIVRYGASTLGQLKDYVARRPDSAAGTSANGLQTWMERHGFDAKVTFQDLFTRGRLAAAMGFNEPLSGGTQVYCDHPILAWSLQVSPASKAALVEVQSAGRGRRIDDAAVNEVRSAFNRYEKRKCVPGKRTPKSSYEELAAYYLGLPEGESASRRFFAHLLSQGLQADPGVGKTMGLRVRDRIGRLRTLVLLRGSNDIDVPGNLDGHAVHLGVTRERVQQLYSDIKATVPRECCQETGGGNHYLRFGHITDAARRMAAAERACSIIEEFLADCRGARDAH